MSSSFFRNSFDWFLYCLSPLIMPPNKTVCSSLFLNLFLQLLALQLLCLHSMVLRLHQNALKDLAEMTRNWMNESVGKNFPLRSHSRHLAHRLGQGRLQLHNLSVVSFFAPEVHYQPSKNSLLYMSTDGGNSEIAAQWSLQSDFLLSMIRSPAFAGSVRAKITGFGADVSIKMAQRNTLAIHQCVSRFDEFQLHLGGSLAADLSMRHTGSLNDFSPVHWFHRPLAQAMQSHVEETYCQLIGEKLLPWLQEQFTRIALKLHIDFGTGLQMTQWLHWVKTGDGHLDLGLAQRLNQRAESNGGRGRLLAEILPWESSTKERTEKHDDHERSVEFFLPEGTLQQIFTGAHLSKQLNVNFSSPFLRTSCPLFCLGKFVPQMRTVLGPTQLFAMLRTNNNPSVRLLQHRIWLKLNVSFELFDQWIMNSKEEEEEHRFMANRNIEYLARNDPPDSQMLNDENEVEEIGEEDEERDEFQTEDIASEDEKEEFVGEGTLIRPKFVGIGEPQEITSQSSLITIVFTTAPSMTQSNVETDRIMATTSRQIQNHHTRPPSIRPHGPVLQIILDSELEIVLVLDKPKRRLRTELRLKKVRAILASHSRIKNLSQKTIDLLVEASIPFLENSVKILYRDGLQLDSLLPLTTRNESVQVEDSFIRFGADISLAQLLQ